MSYLIKPDNGMTMLLEHNQSKIFCEMLNQKIPGCNFKTCIFFIKCHRSD